MNVKIIFPTSDNPNIGRAELPNFAVPIFRTSRYMRNLTDGKTLDLKTNKWLDEYPEDTDFYYSLLPVPKHYESEPPSINKYSPTLAEAETLEELREALEQVLEKEPDIHKRLWLHRDV